MSSWDNRASVLRLLVIFFSNFFFQSDRATQYQETHSTLNEKKKGGTALHVYIY